MEAKSQALLLVLLTVAPALRAQDAQHDAAAPVSFEEASQSMQARLEQGLRELDQLRDRISAEQLPLSRRLNELEAELSTVRAEYQDTTRKLDSRTLDLSTLRTDNQSRRQEGSYVFDMLSEYMRNFEAGLHIAELQRYVESLERARLATENESLSELEVSRRQLALLSVSFERLEEALGGARFEGTAVDRNGLVAQGTFVVIGPAAFFRSADGTHVGTAEQRLGSLEPAVIDYPDPEDALAAAAVLGTGAGSLPVDTTLGNAHKVASTDETLWEHVRKGGPVMVPIFAMAAAAVLVALYKWLSLSLLRRPSRARIQGLLEAVGQGDAAGALEQAKTMGGPVGTMLTAGVEHLREPRELIEEVMYETVLTTRLRLQRFLPFIAICAASAPLLGLLGTVTGIINTFKLITIFGSGDVKTLSGGISEALITTEFGLIVAIPSLLLHAFLSRKAKGVTAQMEAAALAFLNQVSRTPQERVLPARKPELPGILPTPTAVAGGTV